MFVVEQLSLLGLNQREVKVFTILSTFGPMTVTKAAGRSGLPRTTVDAIVRRLETNGLIDRLRVGKHWEWKVDLEEVTKKLSNLTSKLSGGAGVAPGPDMAPKDTSIDEVLACVRESHSASLYVGKGGELAAKELLGRLGPQSVAETHPASVLKGKAVLVCDDSVFVYSYISKSFEVVVGNTAAALKELLLVWQGIEL